jgi:hypothetical protein
MYRTLLTNLGKKSTSSFPPPKSVSFHVSWGKHLSKGLSDVWVCHKQSSAGSSKVLQVHANAMREYLS